MEKVLKRFNTILNFSIIMLLLDIVVGVLFVLITDLSTKVITIMLGMLIFINGLFSLLRYIYDGLGNRIFFLDLISSVVYVILGIFTMFNPYKTLEVLGILFGIKLLATGFEKSYYGIKFMKAHEEIYPLILIISILLVVSGILAIVNPFESFMLITKVIGIFMICSALFNAMFYMLLKKRAKNVLDLFE